MGFIHKFCLDIARDCHRDELIGAGAAFDITRDQRAGKPANGRIGLPIATNLTFLRLVGNAENLYMQPCERRGTDPTHAH